jgi:hypothetical protein
MELDESACIGMGKIYRKTSVGDAEGRRNLKDQSVDGKKALKWRFQVLTEASMKFRIVFWDVLLCKLPTDVSEVRAATFIRDDGGSTYH